MSEPDRGGGGYITRGRALELERLIAASEARLATKVENLEAEVRAVRATNIDLLRALAAAVMETLRAELAGHAAPAGTTPIRQRTGGT